MEYVYKDKSKSKSTQRRNVSNVEAKDVPRIFTEDGGLMIPVVIAGTRGKCRERAPSCKVIIPRFYACSRYKATNALLRRGRRKHSRSVHNDGISNLGPRDSVPHSC